MPELAETTTRELRMRKIPSRLSLRSEATEEVA